MQHTAHFPANQPSMPPRTPILLVLCAVLCIAHAAAASELSVALPSSVFADPSNVAFDAFGRCERVLAMLFVVVVGAHT